MRLKLKELRQVTEQTITEHKMLDVFRAEISRVLGPSVITEGNLNEIAMNANDRITVLEHTGRSSALNFKTSLMKKLVESESPEARKLAARTLPIQMITKLVFDRVGSVRAAAARRLPRRLVSEAMKRFPKDYELKYIYESGLPNPKTVDEEFDMYGDDRLASSHQAQTPELSNQWYEDLAHKFVRDYGTNLEGQWEEALVERYISSVYATSRVPIDAKKLYNLVKKTIKAREDRVLKKDALKEHAHVSFMPVIDENDDHVTALVRASISGDEFIKRANQLFLVREAKAPASLRKYRFHESYNSEQVIPCVGHVPGDRLREVDERALDMYVKHWNKRQELRGDPLRLAWTPNPIRMGAISFSAEVK